MITKKVKIQTKGRSDEDLKRDLVRFRQCLKFYKHPETIQEIEGWVKDLECALKIRKQSVGGGVKDPNK